MEIILIVFLEKKKYYSRQFCHFGPEMVLNHNLLDLLSGVFKKFCTIKRAKSYIKILLVVF